MNEREKEEQAQKRIHDLAEQLKKIHLAANMEEALKKAKEIVTSEEGKTIRDLMGEYIGEVRKQHPKNPDEELKEVKSEAKEDKKKHDLEKEEIEDSEEELNEIACAEEDVEELIDEAKKVQKSSKE